MSSVCQQRSVSSRLTCFSFWGVLLGVFLAGERSWLFIPLKRYSKIGLEGIMQLVMSGPLLSSKQNRCLTKINHDPHCLSSSMFWIFIFQSIFSSIRKLIILFTVFSLRKGLIKVIIVHTSLPDIRLAYFNNLGRKQTACFCYLYLYNKLLHLFVFLF